MEPGYFLGWIPGQYLGGHIQTRTDFFNEKRYGVWCSYGSSQDQFKTASSSDDARDRWYFNVVVTVQAKQTVSRRAPARFALGHNLLSESGPHNIAKPKPPLTQVMEISSIL